MLHSWTELNCGLSIMCSVFWRTNAKWYNLSYPYDKAREMTGIQRYAMLLDSTSCSGIKRNATANSLLRLCVPLSFRALLPRSNTHIRAPAKQPLYMLFWNNKTFHRTSFLQINCKGFPTNSIMLFMAVSGINSSFLVEEINHYVLLLLLSHKFTSFVNIVAI